VKIDWDKVKRGLLHQGSGYDPHYEERAQVLFIFRVLVLFSEAQVHDDLLWHPVNAYTMAFAANVSDVFEWGSADLEEISLETLPVLERTFGDLREIGGLSYMAMLYAARMRKRRPMQRAYPRQPEIAALLDACGPERGAKLGPQRKPLPSENTEPSP
jgi:hypothetical protein